MKNLRNIILTAVAVLVFTPGRAQRDTVALDGGGWIFRTDAGSTGWGAWQAGVPGGREVRVPHTWNVEDGTERYFGLAWYERHAEVPAAWKGRRVRLCFDAVYRDMVCYVNGREAGRNTGTGFTPVSFDVTPLLRYGVSNRIVVAVSNRFSEHAFPYKAAFDWPNDGGIIRPVALVATDGVPVRYAHIKPDVDLSDSSAVASVKIRLWDERVRRADFTLTVLDWKTREPVAEKRVALKAEDGVFTTGMAFEKVRLWHFDAPNLYVMRVDVHGPKGLQDRYETRFGFRKLAIEGDRLLFNGEPVRLPGVEYMPGSYPDYGMAEPVGVMAEAVRLMKELNCVVTRFHWQQDARILDMMDEQGMLVQEELPWWQQPGDPNPELEALLKHQLDVTVERDYNRPSILSWGVSNEVYHNTDKSVYRRMIDHARSWNTNAFVTVVSNQIYTTLANDESLMADIPTWNDYSGTWHGGDRTQSPVRLGLIDREALKGRPLLITEHGLCEPRFVGGDPRRITEMTYHYDAWAECPFVMGCIYFSLNDYRTHVGESGRGRYKARIHGLTDMWFGKKPSFGVYAGLASPVYFESVQQHAGGTQAEVTIVVKNSLPSYTLRGYTLVWDSVDGERSLPLPALKPGDKFTATIGGTDPHRKPRVRVVRPTGYVAAEND